MENVFVMSHASDIDGVGSAALIKMKYSLPEERLFFSDYSKQALAYVDKKLDKFYKSGITLFIADLGVSDSISDSYLKILKKVRKYGGKIYWFDHHPWSESSTKKLASLCEVAIIGENKDFCATEITYRQLGFKDDFTRNFVRIVHYSDFNLRPKSEDDYRMIGIYAMSIASYSTNGSWDYITRKLRHIADIVSRGKMSDAGIMGDAQKFNATNQSRAEAMARQLEIRKKVAIGFAKSIQSTYGCGAVMDKSGKKIAIYVNIDSSRGHIRSKDSDISPLARAMGGGGHPHAAAFDIGKSKFNGFKTKKDKERFADFIEKKIVSLKI